MRGKLVAMLIAGAVLAGGTIAGAHYSDTHSVVWIGDPDSDTLVVGDSYSLGAGTDLEHSWVAEVSNELGWTPSIAAESSSGFLHSGIHGHTAADILQAADGHDNDPDRVIIAIGFNDAYFAEPVGETARAAVDTIRAVESTYPAARILVVGPWDPPGSEDAAGRLDDALRDATAPLNVQYLSPASERWLEGTHLVDSVHPDAAGHRRIAQSFIAALN